MGEEAFTEHQSTLVGVAYRILGSLADAEDVVQDTWLRWHSVMRRQVTVEDHRAYLIQIVTRLAIDRLRSAQVRRESYVGPWLPEPVADTVITGAQDGDDPIQHLDRQESASLGLLVVLESLSPLERAVYVLREAFGLPFSDIARTLDRSEAAVRQLARRSRTHVAQRRVRYDTDPLQLRMAIGQFMAAASSGDMAGMLRVLAPDVTVIVDTDGKVRGVPRPIHTAEKVARFFRGASDRAPAGTAVSYEPVNGLPGAVLWQGGRPLSVIAVEMAEERIGSVYWIANPDKLTRYHRDLIPSDDPL